MQKKIGIVFSFFLVGTVCTSEVCDSRKLIFNINEFEQKVNNADTPEKAGNILDQIIREETDQKNKNRVMIGVGCVTAIYGGVVMVRNYLFPLCYHFDVPQKNCPSPKSLEVAVEIGSCVFCGLGSTVVGLGIAKEIKRCWTKGKREKLKGKLRKKIKSD